MERKDYQKVTERNAEFLLSELRTPEGRLCHTWKARPEQSGRGGVAKVNGYLEDYTHLSEGLVELYQTTLDPRWYEAAHELAETMIEHLGADVGFYDTSDDHDSVRGKADEPGGAPSGSSTAHSTLSVRTSHGWSDLAFRQIEGSTWKPNPEET